ncbi:hypothetical protein EMCRGX_G011827 [Ephydatia muelleri]
MAQRAGVWAFGFAMHIYSHLGLASSFEGACMSGAIINSSCFSCSGVYLTCRQQLVDGLCHGRGNEVVGFGSSEDSNSSLPDVVTIAQAYGYGFLLSIAVSGTSLFALLLVPCLKPGARLFFLYKPINALMMGSASSALLSDAVLHILPEIYAVDKSSNATSKENTAPEPRLFLWRACLLIAAVYFFFVFEFFLHVLRSKEIGSHSHSHKHSHGPTVHASVQPSVEIPGDCKTESQNEKSSLLENHTLRASTSCFREIKPLAWLLITGDSIHNFTDGVALGVAISSSLSLGISTAIALVLHEIPHELADFAILISTGMKWYVAFLLNFLHSLAAMVGFFVGVAIGTNSEAAVDWILTATIGIFLYISLVDLLPSIIHNTEKGYMLAVIFIMASIGFAVSFVSLLLIAIYEDELNQIVH